MEFYSIIIPVYNELTYIPGLLRDLSSLNINNNEILIIDDGSTDGSRQLLKNCNFIKLIILQNNQGKGTAIKRGLAEASNDKIIIFDGDLELNPKEIIKLMILDKANNINAVFGYRFNSLNPLKSSMDWGNFIFTTFFNILHNSSHKDILCCAKAFYNNDLKYSEIISEGFDIDVELSSKLTHLKGNNRIYQRFLSYRRRAKSEGKKLKVSDGWIILKRMILSL